MKKALIILLLLPALLSAETGYRKVHPDGTVEFSDQPLPGGEEIKLRRAPVIRFTPQTPSPSTSGKVRDFSESDKGAAVEASITITSPQADQTLRFDTAGLVVTVAVTPALQDGQQVVIRMDGVEVAHGDVSRFLVRQVYRGSHTLSASIVGRDGAVLASSSAVTFHIKQRSIYNKELEPLPAPSPIQAPEPPVEEEGA